MDALRCDQALEDFSRQVLSTLLQAQQFLLLCPSIEHAGFHKVPTCNKEAWLSAIGSTESTIWEFSHVSFIRNRPDLLINVRRNWKDWGRHIPNNINFIKYKCFIWVSSKSGWFHNYSSSLSRTFLHLSTTNALRTDLQSPNVIIQLFLTKFGLPRASSSTTNVIDRILRFYLFSQPMGNFLAGGINSNALSVLQASESESVQMPLLVPLNWIALVTGNISGNEMSCAVKF